MKERDELREQILDQVRDERQRQLELYGPNDDLQIGFGSGVVKSWLFPFSSASAKRVSEKFREDYSDHELANGSPTWMHLIREEVAELFEADSKEDRITEAVQVAALCVSLAEHLLQFGDLGLKMSHKNLLLIIKAYDDGAGGNLDLRQRDDGWVEGMFDGFLMYEGIEIDGTLYSISHMSGGQITVAVDEEISTVDGVWFDTVAEARAYIKGLSAK